MDASFAGSPCSCLLLRSTSRPTSTTTCSARRSAWNSFAAPPARTRDRSSGAFLDGLVGEIEEDRDTLLAVIGELGVKPDQLKVAAGWTAEKLGRLKPNGQLLGYSPLSPLVELEGLLIGIQGKLAMWQALAEVAEQVGLERARFEALSARAERQQTEVESHRLDVARTALTAV